MRDDVSDPTPPTRAWPPTPEAAKAKGEPRELLCMICGVEHPVWSAENSLWNATLRTDGRDEWPFLCPTCFMNKAVERGVETMFFVQRNDPMVNLGGQRIVDTITTYGTPPPTPTPEVARLRAALEPFARFACDPSESDAPCDCHNCIARRALATRGTER